jgi:hypothetical protein
VQAAERDLILDDETGPDDDEIKMSVEEWLRFNPQPKFTNGIRDRLRVFRFLRKPPAVSALHDRQASFSDTMVATVAFNRPDVIEWQIYLLRRHLAERDGYIVFDNSSNDDARLAIADLCQRQRVPYVGLPRNKLYVSASHGLALNWITRNFVRKFRPLRFGFIDHDIFPTRAFSIRERMQGIMLYGYPRRDTPTPGGWFLWPGFCFYDGSVLRRRLDFAPSGKFHMDAGGGNWPLLYRPADPRQVRFAERKWHRFGAGRSLYDGFFKEIDGWLHVGNASQWKQPQVDRREPLGALLRQASGADAPEVTFEPI